MAARTQRTMEALRRRVGWSQAELGDAVDCDQPQISQWERGLEIPPHHAERILRAFLQVLDPSTFEPRGLLERLTPTDLSEPWEQVVIRNRGGARL